MLQQSEGQSFNQGIEDLHSFSRAALRKQMQADHGDYDPDDVVLDFTIGAGYPGGAGIVEHVRLSLTELAVKNLAGKPSGTLEILAKGAQALPSWLTEDYVLGASIDPARGYRHGLSAEHQGHAVVRHRRCAPAKRCLPAR